MQTVTPADRLTALMIAALACLVPILAILWVVGAAQRLGLLIFPEQVAGLMLGASLAVCFLRQSLGHVGPARQMDQILALISLALGIYVFCRFQTLSEGSHRHPTEALILGVIVTGLMMEGLRRVVGWTLVIIFGVLMLYALFGQFVPGALQGRPQPLTDVLRYLGTDSSATWGQSLQIAAFVVVLFVLFGSFLMATGGSDFFSEIAGRVSGKGPGGAAKVAVTASALCGMISGSAVSNVMTTGVMTIPVMKRSGFSATNASAIEAVASTGGQLMPPIMGAAAFLMAEMLRVPYSQIIVAAALPAVLYYISVFIQIDFMARRDGMPPMEAGEKQPLVRIAAKGWVAIIAITALMTGIFAFGMTAEGSVIYATFAIILLSGAAFFLGARHGALSPRAILESFIEAGTTTAEVLLITAAAGMIIGLMTLTGLGFTLSYYLMNFGIGNMFGLLVLTAVLGLVLGLGLPTTGVYLLLATLTAPALVQLGIPPMAAHMFVLYYGMLSMITPPIAMAAYAAASIGGADQHATGLAAFRFGWVSYILPFFFIYKPGLLFETPLWQTGYVFASTVVSLTLVAGGFLGHARQPLRPAMRAIWIAVGILMMFPLDMLSGWITEFAVSLAGLLVILHHFARQQGAILLSRTRA